MAKIFNIKMITPDGKKIVDECEILNIVTSSGALGIMAGHLPLIGIISISHLNYKKNHQTYDFAISGGILNVEKDGVTILAESFESKEEIDLQRAELSKARATERLKSSDPNIDIKRAEIALKKALNRLSFFE